MSFKRSIRRCYAAVIATVRPLTLLIAAAVPVAIWASDQLAVLVAGSNLALLAVVGSAQVFAAWAARHSDLLISSRPEQRPDIQPFVSVHVPCCQEPPEVVIRTLDALAALGWDRFEVICLDNNTSDPRLWQPVREHCRRLGPRFRFFHVDRLEGAKAGALNLCLQLTNRRASYIAVVDADYCVSPGFLQHAIAHLGAGDLAQVQFPQAYRNGGHGDEGLTGEYAHYFDVFLPLAERTGASLLTGTMSVIRKDALVEVGGWSDSTITEDAELGARLAVAGLPGRYVPRVVGRGVMPEDLSALRAQRRRWVHGNADTLFGLQPRHWRELGLRRSLGVVAQLTAWFNFLLIPLVVLGVIGLLALDSAGHQLAAQLAAITIVVQLAVRCAVLYLAPCIIGEPRQPVRSALANLGLAWEGATGWLESLVRIRLGFARTCKFARPGSMRPAVPGLVCAAALAGATVGLTASHQWLAAAGAMVGSLIFLSVLALQRQLDCIARHSVREQSTTEPSLPVRIMENERA